MGSIHFRPTGLAQAEKCPKRGNSQTILANGTESKMKKPGNDSDGNMALRPFFGSFRSFRLSQN